MRVLIADDDLDQRTLLDRLLTSWGHKVLAVADGAEALEKVAAFAPNVIVTDLMMPRVGGLEMVDRLRAEGSLPPTIVLTAFGSVDLAVQTVHKHGAFWFAEKPVDSGTLQALLQRASENSRLTAENQRLRLELQRRGVVGDMVGQSAAIQEVFAMVQQVAPTSANVLITGESGTGKELAARAIHNSSNRQAEAFVAINCAAMPETLMESEIFGHEKGAFTGAVERRAGAMEMAQGGTLFLDEIGEMPMTMQAKLLRVLEDFRFRRLGGRQELTADVRLIAATNRSPEQAIRKGRLREDLFYRLNVFRIEMPPLRDRVEDVALIATAMIEKFNVKHGTRITHLDPSAELALKAAQWNGNVRELRNVIERAMILAGQGPLLKTHLMLEKGVTAKPVRANGEGGLSIHLGMTTTEAERVLIEATLQNAQNNKTRAARILGISAKTLHAKIKQYNLEGSSGASEEIAEVAANDG